MNTFGPTSDLSLTRNSYITNQAESLFVQFFTKVQPFMLRERPIFTVLLIFFPLVASTTTTFNEPNKAPSTENEASTRWVNWPNAVVHLERKLDISSQSNPKEAEPALIWFVRRLKLFISEGGFDSEAFEKSAAKLELQLSGITQWVAQLPPCQAIAAQLAFASRMFALMTSSTEQLQNYGAVSLDQYLVCNVMQLNVGLLALHDSYGLPDPTVKDYAVEVALARRLLAFWKNLYKIMVGVPLGVSLMFESQFTQAENTVRELAKKLPKAGDTTEMKPQPTSSSNHEHCY